MTTVEPGRRPKREQQDVRRDGDLLSLAGVRALESTDYEVFRHAFFRDPAGWVLTAIRWPKGQRPHHYQLDALAELHATRRLALRSLHGVGKSACAAWAVLHFATTRDLDHDWKVPTTASVWRQLEKYLWPDIRKWARLLDWDAIGRPPFAEPQELQERALKLHTGEAFAVASNQPSAIEGAHARQLLFVYDEAKAIPDETFDATEGAFANEGTGGYEAYALALSTPGPPSGRFYAIHRKERGLEDWKTVHVKLDQAIAAGRVNPQWAEARKRQWGEESALYRNRVLGEFAGDPDAVIPLEWVEAAMDRWRDRHGLLVSDRDLALPDEPEEPEGFDPGPLTCMGVDVADGGEDETVLAYRHDRYIAPLERPENLPDTMATAGHVANQLRRRDPARPAVVDVIGIGAGVVARLREEGFQVVAFNAGEAVRTSFRDMSGELEFVNKRAASWWNMRELLDPQYDQRIELPPDHRLLGDLTTPRWWTTGNGRIQVEPKDDIRKRLRRSTDSADPVVQAFAWPTIVPDPDEQAPKPKGRVRFVG